MNINSKILEDNPMHIQDHLRAALLQKRASQVCWKCEHGPLPQLRFIQTDQEARPGEDGTPKEAVPLLGGSQQRTSRDFRASSRSTKTRPDNASRTVNNLSAKARHEDRDPDPKEVLSPIRLWPTHSPYPSVRPCTPIWHGYINNHQRIQIRRRRVTFSISDPLEARVKRPAQWTKRRTKEKPHASELQDRDIGVSIVAKDAPSKPESPRWRWRYSGFDDEKRLPFRTFRKVQIDPKCSIVADNGLEKPIWIGLQNHRIYHFRGSTKYHVRVSYEDPHSINHSGLNEGIRTVAGSTISNEDKTVGVIDEMFQSWLGAAQPSSEAASSRSSSVQEGQGFTTFTDNGGSKSAPSMNGGVGQAPLSRNDHPQDQNPSAPHNSPYRFKSSGRDATWLTSDNNRFDIVTGPHALVARGTRFSRPTSATRISPHRDTTDPSRIYVARLHTGVVQPGLASNPTIASPLPYVNKVGIREHLRLWQELYDQEVAATSPPGRKAFQEPKLIENALTQSDEDEARIAPDSSDPALSRDLGLISVPNQEQEGEADVGKFLRPGDVISCRTRVESMLAVFIRNFDTQSQFYTRQGKWLHMKTQFVSFTIPGVFSQQDIDPIVAHLPGEEVRGDDLGKLQDTATQVPREVGAPMLEKLQAMERASAEVYREHAERLDRIHTLIASETDIKELMLHEIAMIALQKHSVNELTDTMLWTVDKAISRNPYFRASQGSLHRAHPLWAVNPLGKMRSFERVRGWIREYLESEIAKATSPDGASSIALHNPEPQNSNPIPGFMRKARAMVKSIRGLRKVSAQSGLGPILPSAATGDAGRSPPEANLATKGLTSFDEREQALISYLQSWCISWDVVAAGHIFALSPLLLRATGLYEGHDLDERTGFLFLQEMGVIAPWENRFLYKGNVHLPASDNHMNSDRLRPSRKPSDINMTKPAGIPSAQAEARLEDSLHGLRKDWGDLPVYCIDDASAQEIDDGVSVEKVEGEDSVFWVHFHIANPSAFLAPSSPIGRYAAKLVETTYLPEKTYPLLNPKLTQSYFSLAKDRPVLTMSGKLTMDGRILATDLTAGWIRNTKSITPERVGEELGTDQNLPPKDTRILRVGRHPASKPCVASKDTLSPSEVAELRTLQELGTARRLFRTHGRAHQRGYHGTGLEPNVYLGEGNAVRTFNAHTGRQFLSDPSISWEVSDVDGTGQLTLSGGRLFVTDMMILAGEVASRWCGERNIPIIYRGTVPDPAPPMAPEAYRTNVIDRCVRELGYVPSMFYRTYNRYLGSSTARSSPFPHAILGIESYTKATSPLRRYPDMLAHWQMQAALIYEARHGKGSLISSTDNSYLPFSRSDIDALIPTVRRREKSIIEVTGRSAMHWIMQLLHRAFHFKETELPQFFDVLVHKERGALMEQGNALGFTKQLSGLDADLLDNELTKREGGIKVGDWWQCRIEGVDPYRARLKMMPVRLTARSAFGVMSSSFLSG
ncbi:MAG: hypothetical protein Q9208_007240 [Pyrenodesmia sp. 3 TL-2023]